MTRTRIGRDATRFVNLLVGDEQPNRHGQWSTAVTVGVFVGQVAKNLTIIQQRLCQGRFRRIRIAAK